MDISKLEKAQVLGELYKDPIYQQQNNLARERLWRLLLKQQHGVRKHFAEWGGDLELHEAESRLKFHRSNNGKRRFRIAG